MSEDLISAEMQSLLAEFERSGVRELHLRRGTFELYLSSQTGASAPLARTAEVRRAAAPVRPVRADGSAATPASTLELPEHAFIVKAPNLGTFYRAPKPGAGAYVELHQDVGAGDELCLIEVMKLFTTVRADKAGRIHAILAEDGAMVDAGQPLFAIVPGV
jgi:acetyl-CoA carboxylase biotin carboxyl carrier protein